jgi:hypothetical protein
VAQVAVRSEMHTKHRNTEFFNVKAGDEEILHEFTVNLLRKTFLLPQEKYLKSWNFEFCAAV